MTTPNATSAIVAPTSTRSAQRDGRRGARSRELLDERAERVAAILEVAELVERGAGRREQHGVADEGDARRRA